jgi:hypothetical protein
MIDPRPGSMVDVKIKLGAYPWQSQVEIDGKVMAGVKSISVNSHAGMEFTEIDMQVIPDPEDQEVLYLSGKLVISSANKGEG